MGLPYAFMKAGYILSIIILILFNAVIYYSTCLVIDIGEDLRKDKFTFIDIFDISLGINFSYLKIINNKYYKKNNF